SVSGPGDGIWRLEMKGDLQNGLPAKRLQQSRRDAHVRVAGLIINVIPVCVQHISLTTFQTDCNPSYGLATLHVGSEPRKADRCPQFVSGRGLKAQVLALMQRQPDLLDAAFATVIPEQPSFAIEDRIRLVNGVVVPLVL